MASMAAQGSDHDKARELAEKALDKFVEGDEAAGDKLIQQAEKIRTWSETPAYTTFDHFIGQPRLLILNRMLAQSDS
jgi:hypothetical protein